MDPNETLGHLRRLAAFDIDGYPTASDWMPLRIKGYAELFQALDGWLTAGGFLPDAWSR